MFHLLNKNLNLQLFFMAILAFWSAWVIFAKMTLMPAEGTAILYHYVVRIWDWSPVLVRILVLGIVLTMTVGVNHHFLVNHLSENRTYMPGVFLLMMLNFGKFLYILTPALLTSFFLALTIILYVPSEPSAKMKDRIFTFGLIIAIATLLDISAFGIVLFLILMIALNSVNALKDILILLIGLSFPYIYCFAIAFIANGMPKFLQSWADLTIFVPYKQFLSMRAVDYITLAYFVVLISILIIRGKKLYDNKLIVIRQAFTNVHLMLISMLLFLGLGIVPLPMALLYLLLPVAIYLTVAVIPKKYRFVYDFLIVALCALLWL
jgi:hypothetical protein